MILIKMCLFYHIICILRRHLKALGDLGSTYMYLSARAPVKNTEVLPSGNPGVESTLYHFSAWKALNFPESLLLHLQNGESNGSFLEAGGED